MENTSFAVNVKGFYLEIFAFQSGSMKRRSVN